MPKHKCGMQLLLKAQRHSFPDSEILLIYNTRKHRKSDEYMFPIIHCKFVIIAPLPHILQLLSKKLLLEYSTPSSYKA